VRMAGSFEKSPRALMRTKGYLKLLASRSKTEGPD
jgi:hypothetical protein